MVIEEGAALTEPPQFHRNDAGGAGATACRHPVQTRVGFVRIRDRK